MILKRTKTIAMLLIALTITLSTACRKPSESEPYTDEEIYGNKTLGISTEAGKSLKDYKTYLVMGVDDGKRSDIMLIVSVNKNDDTVVTTSVDRDTYMQVLDNGTITVDGHEFEFYKCNRSYKNAGLNGAMKELNRHMDLNIQECVAINWAGVAKVIDMLGGVEADVDENMLYWINNDTRPEGSDSEEYKIEKAGRQTLNGWQAVQYLRVRKYDGGNARVRAERNEEILHQLLNKTKKLTEDERLEVLLNLSESTDSNMTVEELATLIDTICNSKLKTTDVWPYTYETKWDEDMLYYYQVPTTLESNVAMLHQVMFGQEDYVPSAQCKELSDKINELSETSLIKAE